MKTMYVETTGKWKMVVNSIGFDIIYVDAQKAHFYFCVKEKSGTKPYKKLQMSKFWLNKSNISSTMQ